MDISTKRAEDMGRSLRTVLIVDENASMRYYHGLLLMRLHYVVLTADSAGEALTTMERSVPSIVLSSLSLPDMQGTDLFAAIRSNDRLGGVPVIALSETEDQEVRSSCLKRGYSACVAKPADPHRLYCAIQAATEASPRAHIRLNLSLKAVVGDGIDSTGEEAYTSTISEGGMFLQTYYPPPNHTKTPLRIFLSDREIRTTAEVLYSSTLERRTFQQPGMGLKFIELHDDDRTFLQSFIREQLVRDILPGNGRVGRNPEG
jgi:CheY-like chemotaxis protein